MRLGLKSKILKNIVFVLSIVTFFSTISISVFADTEDYKELAINTSDSSYSITSGFYIGSDISVNIETLPEDLIKSNTEGDTTQEFIDNLIINIEDLINRYKNSYLSSVQEDYEPLITYYYLRYETDSGENRYFYLYTTDSEDPYYNLSTLFNYSIRNIIDLYGEFDLSNIAEVYTIVRWGEVVTIDFSGGGFFSNLVYTAAVNGEDLLNLLNEYNEINRQKSYKGTYKFYVTINGEEVEFTNDVASNYNDLSSLEGLNIRAEYVEETTTEDELTLNNKVSLPTIDTTKDVSFTDVSYTHWANPYITNLARAGIINGTSDTTFSPSSNATRADVVVMLIKLLGIENETASTNFDDIYSSKYYANYIGIAKENGIVSGTNGNFNPEQNITRQDTIVMVSNILSQLNIPVNTSMIDAFFNFSDFDEISEYAKESVSILFNSGIISGNDGKLNPKSNITRAEISVIMSNLYDLLKDNNY